MVNGWTVGGATRLTMASKGPRMNAMATREPIQVWGQGDVERGPSGILPLISELRMMEQAIKEGWREGERREVLELMMEVARRGGREGVAAARVLVALERNLIAAERNQVAERGQDLGAATELLRAKLRSPEARKAMVDLTSAMASPAQETPKPPEPPGIPVAQGEGWASAGGTDGD